MKTPIFHSRLFRYPGKGGWTFAPIPKEFSPPFKLAWGRSPVIATVDGKEWSTSVWTDRSGQTLLPVPKKVRGSKEGGGIVKVALEYKI